MPWAPLRWNFFVALRPNEDYGLLIFEDLNQTQRRTTVGRTPLDDWSARRTDLYLTTNKPSQETNIHAPSGIRFHNPSKRVVADPRLRPRGHWNRPPLTTGRFCYPSSHQIVLNFQIWLSILLYISHSLCNCQTLFQCFCRRCDL